MGEPRQRFFLYHHSVTPRVCRCAGGRPHAVLLVACHMNWHATVKECAVVSTKYFNYSLYCTVLFVQCRVRVTDISVLRTYGLIH